MTKVTKSWGYYEVLIEDDGFLVKKIVINPQQAISYQFHRQREELWYVIQGRACIILNDAVTFGDAGTVFKVPEGAKHKVINTSQTQDLICVEVWRGVNLSEDDIIRIGR